MFRRKVIVAVVCIILLLSLIIGKFLYDKDDVEHGEIEGDEPLTFYDLIKDITYSSWRDIPTLKFASFVSGDNITVRDRINKMEILANVSTVYNDRNYSYTVNIWLDSLKEYAEYYEEPTLSMVSDWNRNAIESELHPGDDITMKLTVRSNRVEPQQGNTRGDITTSRSHSDGMHFLNVAGLLNDDRTKVEQINIKVVLLSGFRDTSILDTIIEISFDENKENILYHLNNTAFYLDTLEFREIVAHPGVFIYRTLLDDMEKPEPATVDLFSYGIIRDMEECSLSNGILTPGDVINIKINFSQFQKPPTGGGLGPETFVQIKILPKHGLPNIYEFTVPDTFPEDEKWVQL